jgi:hypothetical protein
MTEKKDKSKLKPDEIKNMEQMRIAIVLSNPALKKKYETFLEKRLDIDIKNSNMELIELEKAAQGRGDDDDDKEEDEEKGKTEERMW